MICLVIFTAFGGLGWTLQDGGGGYTFTAADIEEGARNFMASCAACHGPDGDAIGGAELDRELLPRARTDAELRDVVENGIPGTGMPPSNLNVRQVDTIVGYVRSLALSGPAGRQGDPARGRAVFEESGCLGCHRVFGEGGRRGPDLGTIGLRRAARDLEQSILNPDAEILPENRSIVAVTESGETVRGRLLNQNTLSLQLAGTDGRLFSLERRAIESLSEDPDSPMPSYGDRLDASALDDLVAYLVSLRGRR